VKVVKTNYTVKSLREALKGQDAVISVLGMGGKKDQFTLVDAASDVGVKWFFPSEFGHNTGSEIVRAFIPLLAEKRKVVERLAEKEKAGMCWTAVINGYFFDYVRIPPAPFVALRLLMNVSRSSKERFSVATSCPKLPQSSMTATPPSA
jgi:NmrA-like family